MALPVTTGLGSGQVVQVTLNVKNSAMGRVAGSLNRKMILTGRATIAKGSVATVQSPAGVGRANGPLPHAARSMPTESTTAERPCIGAAIVLQDETHATLVRAANTHGRCGDPFEPHEETFCAEAQNRTSDTEFVGREAVALDSRRSLSLSTWRGLVARPSTTSPEPLS